MEPQWPMRVTSHELIPVFVDGGGPGTVHLVERAEDYHHGAGVAAEENGSWSGADALSAAGWRTRTLCGLRRAEMAPEVDAADLLAGRDWLGCRSCRRIVEGWLSAPPPAEGEEAALRWLLDAVLEVGEALIEGVPLPRVEAFRCRVRKELKAMIGGAVRTERIGPAALHIRSGLVQDAKTPERWQEELHAAAQRMWDIQSGRPVDSPRWRRHWNDIIDTD
ncbi:MAG: hypothetical protein ACRDYY_07555 [Acidimicrobiales bacterium]